MADTLRIKSTLPLALRVSESHPDPEKPGNSPVLKQAVIYPGVNEFSGDEMAAYQGWASAAGKDFVASPEDVKAGNTDGKVYEMSEDEPEQEFGFEPALKRAVDANSSEAEKGSTLTDKGPVKAEDMRTGSGDAVVLPVVTSAAPLKTPLTVDPSKK